jgi:hypothetical protein
MTKYRFPPQDLPAQGSKTDDVLHGVKSRALAARPQRRSNRALSENSAVGGDMGKLDALAGAGENHLVLADHVAAAQGGKADVAFAARADVAVTGAGSVVFQGNATA